MMRRFVCIGAALLLGACAMPSPDRGFDRVAQLTRERAGVAPAYQRGEARPGAVQSRVDELLRSPLTADAAAEIALLNNRGLQAALAELGVAESERVRAGRLPNPTLRFSRLAGGGVVEIERALVFNLMQLATLPVASRVEQARFEQAQLQAASEAVRLAAQARRAFYQAVAAQQLQAYAAQVKEAADASNELARKMVQAGNFSRLAQMREQSFYADATAQLARAQHQALAERERLVRLLGLPSASPLKLPERLPDLPAAPYETADAEQTAMDSRLDVMMAKRSAQATADALGLSRTTCFINVLDVGYQNASKTGEPRHNGYEIELQLPLFDFGSSRVARAEATYMQAVHRTAQVAIDARSEVRVSYSAYRTAYDLARHYRDEVVPLRQRISEENLLRYNGMLASVFDLLADSREQIASVQSSVEALRDHWLADTELRTALTGRSPVEADASAARPRAATVGPADSH